MLGRAVRSHSCPIPSALPCVPRDEHTPPEPEVSPWHRAAPKPAAGPALPSPADTVHSVAPHSSTPLLEQAAAALTPQERLTLASVEGDQVTGMRLRDLLTDAQRDGGVPGMAHLLSALAADGQPPAKRIRCLHNLSRLWPRWSRGQGLLELTAALQPGAQIPLTWRGLMAEASALLDLKGSFRALETSQLQLMHLLTAPLAEGELLRPTVPRLHDLPAGHADVIVQLLHRCPQRHRRAFAQVLVQAKAEGPEETTALYTRVPDFSVSEWDTFMQAVSAMRGASWKRGTLPINALLRALLHVASLGSNHAVLFAEFVERAEMHTHAAVLQKAEGHWLHLADLEDLRARSSAAMEFAHWAQTAQLSCCDLVLQRFFDPSLKDPAAYIALLRKHRGEQTPAATLKAMLEAPRDQVAIASLVGQADARLLNRVQAMLPRAHAVAPWLQICSDNPDAMLRVLDIAERVPQAHLQALAQRMLEAPRSPEWLQAAHACSTGTLTRFSVRPWANDGRRGWMQLAACAVADTPGVSGTDTPPLLATTETSEAPCLNRYQDALRYLPSEAHRRVWTDDTSVTWSTWSLAQIDMALRAAGSLTAEDYASVMQTLQRLGSQAPRDLATLRELNALPAEQQRCAMHALLLFGTPATSERQTLARLLFSGLTSAQLAPALTCLRELTHDGERPSDDELTALLLPLVPRERLTLITAMAGELPWSWRDLVCFLRRVPPTQRLHTAELLRDFQANRAEVPATPEVWQELLTHLQPATALGMLRDMARVMISCAPPPDLILLAQVLNTFNDGRSRHLACNTIRPRMAPDLALGLLMEAADASQHLPAAPVAAPEPVMAQVWEGNENVMLAERRAAVGRAIEALKGRYPEAVGQVLSAFMARPLSPLARETVRLILGVEDPVEVTATCRVRPQEVLQGVLNAIAQWQDPAGESATEVGRENMRKTLERNLERCWEPNTDGRPGHHAVCLIGQYERMVLSLNGYDRDVQLVLVTPRELVNEVAAPLQAQRGDSPVSQEQLHAMLRTCHDLAQELFLGDATLIAECDAVARAAVVYLRD